MEMENSCCPSEIAFPAGGSALLVFSRLNDGKGQLKHCPTIMHVGLQLD